MKETISTEAVFRLMGESGLRTRMLRLDDWRLERLVSNALEVKSSTPQGRCAPGAPRASTWKWLRLTLRLRAQMEKIGGEMGRRAGGCGGSGEASGRSIEIKMERGRYIKRKRR